MSRWVLDASAIMAFVHGESGADRVAQAIEDEATVSAVNLSEVIAKLNEGGMLPAAIRAALDLPGLDVAVFDAELGYAAGLLRSPTRHLGLSLGDRACLSFAHHLNLPVLTADRAWESLKLDVEIHLIR